MTREIKIGTGVVHGMSTSLNLVVEHARWSTSCNMQIVMLCKGLEAKCECLGFQLPPTTHFNEYLIPFESLGISNVRQSSPQQGVDDALEFEDTKDNKIESWGKANRSGKSRSNFGISPDKLSKVAFNCADVKRDVGCTTTGWALD